MKPTFGISVVILALFLITQCKDTKKENEPDSVLEASMINQSLYLVSDFVDVQSKEDHTPEDILKTYSSNPLMDEKYVKLTAEMIFAVSGKGVKDQITLDEWMNGILVLRSKKRDDQVSDLDKAKIRKNLEKIFNHFKNKDEKLNYENLGKIIQLYGEPIRKLRISNVRTKESAPQVQRDVHHDLLTDFDSNTDGFLEESEYKSYIQKREDARKEWMERTKQDAPPNRFKSWKEVLMDFDADNDSKLNKEEVKKWEADLKKRTKYKFHVRKKGLLKLTPEEEAKLRSQPPRSK